MDRNEEALSAFDFAIISEDQFTGAYIEKGKVLEKMGRFNEAIENFQISIQIDDPSSYAYLRIAKCHQALGNDMLALQYFKKSVQEDPASEKSWNAMIDFYIQLGDIDKAFYYTKKALLINEDSVGYNKRNALLLQTLGQYTEAEIAYQNTSSTRKLRTRNLDRMDEYLDFPKRMGKNDYHRASSKRVLS